MLLGFHGCDQDIRDAVVTGDINLHESRNSYDWLGSGIYFWENDHRRALNFAQNHPVRTIKHPSVLGAVIEPGYCLNLLNSEYLMLVKNSFKAFTRSFDTFEVVMPPGKCTDGIAGGRRELDCQIIENLHQMRQSLQQPPFESVRSAFSEGPELYPGAGFHEKNHIQICVRNPNCIKGFFIPRQETDWP